MNRGFVPLKRRSDPQAQVFSLSESFDPFDFPQRGIEEEALGGIG